MSKMFKCRKQAKVTMLSPITTVAGDFVKICFDKLKYPHLDSESVKNRQKT